VPRVARLPFTPVPLPPNSPPFYTLLSLRTDSLTQYSKPSSPVPFFLLHTYLARVLEHKNPSDQFRSAAPHNADRSRLEVALCCFSGVIFAGYSFVGGLPVVVRRRRNWVFRGRCMKPGEGPVFRRPLLSGALFSFGTSRELLRIWETRRL
jgi:hypothetical protein